MSDQFAATSPYSLASGAGKSMTWFESTITLKASHPELGITEVVLHPGEEPPLHIHKNENEWLYVLDGQMTFHVAGEQYSASAGSFVSFPRDIPHTFTIESAAARFLVVNTPGGFERMFELGPKTPEEAARANASLRHGDRRTASPPDGGRVRLRISKMDTGPGEWRA
jgi:quercetin dioxygenase-like cupin family protein